MVLKMIDNQVLKMGFHERNLNSVVILMVALLSYAFTYFHINISKVNTNKFNKLIEDAATRSTTNCIKTNYKMDSKDKLTKSRSILQKNLFYSSTKTILQSVLNLNAIQHLGSWVVKTYFSR